MDLLNNSRRMGTGTDNAYAPLHPSFVSHSTSHAVAVVSGAFKQGLSKIEDITSHTLAQSVVDSLKKTGG